MRGVAYLHYKGLVSKGKGVRANLPFYGAKALDYADFCKIITIMNNKGHLTKTGMADIIK